MWKKWIVRNNNVNNNITFWCKFYLENNLGETITVRSKLSITLYYKQRVNKR